MNQYLITFINILILLAIAIGIPTIVIALLSCFKIKINKAKQTYLYAFAAGLIIILGSVGFLMESITHAKEYLLTISTDKHKILNVAETFQLIGIVGGGALIGILITIFARLIFTKISKKKGDWHAHHHDHNHHEFLFNASDMDNNSLKWIPILLLLGHRSLDGIVLGFMANTEQIAQFSNIGMIVTFALHLVPTTIIIYLIQLDIQKTKRWKAFFISFLILIIMIPFTFIGGYLINAIKMVWWLMPLLYSISGSLMILASILEIIPEFIHNRNASLKQWLWTTGWLSMGIITSIILISIHSH